MVDNLEKEEKKEKKEEKESIKNKHIDEIKTLEEKVVRLDAEIENIKKRSEREADRMKETAGADIIKSLLPILDEFELAIEHMNNKKKNDECKEVIEGVDMIYKKLSKTLNEKGLNEMKCINKTFDPYLHDAIKEKEVDDKGKDGKIIEVVQKGYYYNNNILRHAKVVVGRKRQED